PDVTQPAALQPEPPPALEAVEPSVTDVVVSSSAVSSSAPTHLPAPNDEPFELSDNDFEPLLRAFEPEPAPFSCQLSLEAGRALSECSFHREEGGDFVN